MATATITSVDDSVAALGSWQLAIPLSPEGTALTVAELTVGPVRTSSYTVSPTIFQVSRFGKIAMQIWGSDDGGADNNETINFAVYGWCENGPGTMIATVVGRYGNFTSAANTGFHTNAHQSIMDGLIAGEAYRGTDIYTVTDYEAMITVYAGREDDFPSKMVLDLTNSQYHFLGIRFTGGTQAGNVAAIFKPLTLRDTSPQRAVKMR